VRASIQFKFEAEKHQVQEFEAVSVILDSAVCENGVEILASNYDAVTPPKAKLRIFQDVIDKKVLQTVEKAPRSL
jgi:hypothetical protein